MHVGRKTAVVTAVQGNLPESVTESPPWLMSSPTLRLSRSGLSRSGRQGQDCQGQDCQGQERRNGWQQRPTLSAASEPDWHLLRYTCMAVKFWMLFEVTLASTNNPTHLGCQCLHLHHPISFTRDALPATASRCWVMLDCIPCGLSFTITKLI